ncbi:ATP-dependent DNA helicase DinG [Pseudomonas turukhanskensis]|uniref:ATP-dependent DNA helicase DinG n=1 Tax=Pseudomonas turukhanskensis TaxID=1806536 RepID=A0A9W6NG86_9PSED|nr:ATP-dependent DNA helicase DinG [Pseudomonas turukhanskensis]GLK89575.1 ATP-dependent DNA helicase DinG [Pseudomonas turukhanskensis]
MLSTEIKSQIQGAYSRFLEAKGLKPRYGQRLMIAEIAKVLGTIKVDDEGRRSSDPAVVAVEAGTGTGKTVAYSLATIPLAKAAGKRLVIATATVALQEQIVFKDLPEVMRNSGLNFTFGLAKGRGRYLCLSKLDILMQEGESQNATAALFEEEGFKIEVDQGNQKLYTQMVEKLAGGKWDGDRDSWSEALEDADWARLTTDHSQCTNRHCPNFQTCAFYKAREGMGKVDVIVTNHDMVLADLALGGGAVLPDPRDTLYVFDEGHHLPDKAIGHFAHYTRLRSTADWLELTAKNLTKLLAQNPLPGDLGRLIEQVPILAREIRTQQQFMFNACEQLADFKAGEDMEGRERPRHRFVGGVVPEHLTEMGLELKKGFSRLTDLFTGLTELLKKSMDGEASIGIASHQAEEWYPLFGSLLARAQGNWELWLAFTAEDPEESPPMARWLTLAEGGAMFDIEVNASPILAAETLRRNLWNVAYGALVTSATLTALGTFDRFRMRAGLPKVAVTAVVPSPFHHSDAGVLRVPDLKADPRDAAAHTAAIIRELPGLVEGSRGTLVLFSSRKQMQDVFDGVDREWRKRVFIQGNLSKQETLNKHKARVDDGESSVLFGLASFAEGVDLPGAYCEHVVIAKIPFAVPDDPVEAALAEWIEARGGNPFMEIAVPDASLRLVQACGRLLRTEADRGTITLLDRRVVTQRYGKAILNALPPFRREIT